MVATRKARSLSRLRGEGWGGGVSATGHSPRGENPHPALRADLPRKRERLQRPRGQIALTQRRSA
ncbi:hypothetical protein B5V03_35595 [Bradyrhizobium betae]|uniref:Uncharacterized protein n=1 Tax=Bradyrhizobium betae TaxID=244734 RepID=A0A4Q1UKD4_9BRAD|nr:hypothetical protein B5V03_35595 [Bradyrhizobium betae]